MNTFEFAVPTLFGLEGIAGDELRRLNIDNVRVENGRVLFSGDTRAMAKANVCLRESQPEVLRKGQPGNRPTMHTGNRPESTPSGYEQIPISGPLHRQR